MRSMVAAHAAAAEAYWAQDAVSLGAPAKPKTSSIYTQIQIIGKLTAHSG
jgi:hypothetical protein